MTRRPVASPEAAPPVFPSGSRPPPDDEPVAPARAATHEVEGEPEDRTDEVEEVQDGTAGPAAVGATGADDDADDDEPDELQPSRAEAHLYLELQRFSFCLERHAARRGDAPPAGPPRGEPGGEELVARIGLEIEALDGYIDEQFPEPELPIARLRRRFAIDDAAVRVLVAAAAPALDLSLARRLAAITGRSQPDAGLLVSTTARDLAEERAALAALRQTAPLVRRRLVRLGASPNWTPETPLLHRPVVVPERVTDWLRGDTAFDPERFERAAVLWIPVPDPESDPRQTAGPVARALYRSDGARRLPLVVAGPALAGKAAAVLAAAEAQGLPTLDVDLQAVAASAQPIDLLLDLVREAMLHDAVLLLRRGDGLRDRAELRRAVAAVLGDGALWTAITTRGEWRDDALRIAGAQVVEIELPAAPDQLAVWRRAVPPAVPCEPDVHASVAARYRLAPGDILAAGADAIHRAELRGPDARVGLGDVEQAIRARLRHRLRGVAELTTTPLGWADLVVSDPVAHRILELLASIRYQTQVMDRWGFAKKLAGGRTVRALLSGPPGTGKTLVAALIAKDLGLDLLRVDLARAAAAPAGEIERDLDLVFDEASRAHAVLLLEAADAVFPAARPTGPAASYLAERLDAFDGVALAATSRPAAIDDAFRARLPLHIEFPAPDAAERAQLWQAMLPPEVPVAHDIDFADLAQRYAMTGRFIKNAVVRAAYLAAGEQLPGLTNAILRRAAQIEWDAMDPLTRNL